MTKSHFRNLHSESDIGTLHLLCIGHVTFVLFIGHVILVLWIGHVTLELCIEHLTLVITGQYDIGYYFILHSMT